MPNDEYFECVRRTSEAADTRFWRSLSVEQQLEWTLVFLEYPPRFLGVIGMLATSDAYKHGKPTTHSIWQATASRYTELRIQPLLYAYIRSRIARELDYSDWRIVRTWLDHGHRLSIIVEACEQNDARWSRSVRLEHEQRAR